MQFCPLFSGSSGNSSYIEGGNARILIDAGMACRTITGALCQIGASPESIDALVITHEHSDHIRGVGIFARRYKTPIYANARTWEAMQPYVGEIPAGCIRIFETGRDFYIKDMNVLPFKTPHDAAESVGYCFQCREGKVGLMTDIGHITAKLLNAVQGADLLLIEANHDVETLKMGSYPYVLKRRILGDEGHLSNDSAGLALIKLYAMGLRNAILGHLSKENNSEAMAMDTVRTHLRSEDIFDDEFKLHVAHRDRTSGVFQIAK